MNFNILFLYGGKSRSKSSYSFRLDRFKSYFDDTNIKASSIYLKDSGISVPSLLLPMNFLFLSNSLRNYNVIHAGGAPSAYFMQLSKRIINTKFIYDVHGSLSQEYLLSFNKHNLLDYYNLLQALIMEYFANRSSYFITCSDPLKEYFISKGIDESNIEVIRNGVNLDVFKPLNISKETDRFIITYAGGFQRWQGIENLINAAKILRNSGILFRIIGFKSEDIKLKSYINSELKDLVETIDSLSQSKLVELLNSSDILIIPRNDHPAINVASPTKFAEYIAIGKPVIVTDVDETANFVKKFDCGFVCKPTPESIADTILVAKNTPIEELKIKGQNARKLAKREFDQNIINKRYYDFIQNVVLESKNEDI